MKPSDTENSAPSGTDYPEIPYGRAYFKGIRFDGCLYVDKTRFLRPLERHRHVFFIRPRRFGKTCWLSLMESYYDRNEADDFDAVFGGTHIGRDPTPNRSRYVVLRFNFSAFNAALETLETHFENYCRKVFADTVERHPDLFSEQAIERMCAEPTIIDKLQALFLHCRRHGIPLYILIDEYDNFANIILAQHGADAYHSCTHGGGFYRSFFATLKAGTENGSVERLFVTGVSPITMDDVTSGFNIGTNISLLPEYNELLGFTEAEVRTVLSTYQRLGVFDHDIEATLGLMREWYSGYRFAIPPPAPANGAPTVPKEAVNAVHNTDMVLYYLNLSVPNKPGPERLIDSNVRIDYGKLRHLLLTGRRLNGNFDLLRETLGDGTAHSALADSFPQAELIERENFLALLHYFGLLSIRDRSEDGTVHLDIPNQTVRQLMYGYLRGAYRDVGAFSPDFVTLERLTRRMAVNGEWRPFVERLRTALAEHTGIRDYLHGEKVVQSFLAAYLTVAGCFVVHTEMELGKGYADIVLEPLAHYPELRHGFVVELKYLARGSSAKARVPALAAQAERQLRNYLADTRLERLHSNVEFTGLALVFQGWELAHSAEVRLTTRVRPTQHSGGDRG